MKERKKRKLPEGWRWDKIADYIQDYQSGIACGEKSKSEGHAHLRMNNISKDFNLNLSLLWRIPTSVVDKDVTSYSVEKGDILFNNTNSPELVGKSCIFNFNSEDIFLFSNHLTRIRTKDTLVPYYLLAWIRFLWLRRFFENHCTIWNNQAAIRIEEKLLPLKMPLPPTLSDQTRIAAELERKMNEVEKMRHAALRRKEAISAMQGAILREVFPRKEGDKLPDGWRWETIRNNMENSIEIFDKASYSGDGFYYIDITSIDNINKRIFGVKQIPVGDAPSRAKYTVRENDIIVSTVRPNLNAVALIDKNYDGYICSNGFCVVRLKKDQHPPYYFYFLMSPCFVETVSKKVQGTMYPAINDDYVKDFEIPLPLTLSDQTRIATELERKMAEIETMRQAADSELEAISSLPGAILREVFDFEEENTGSQDYA